MHDRRAADAYDGRAEPRDETLYRALATIDGEARQRLLIVNLSPHGFMARTERDLRAGQHVALTLPHAGSFVAAVRWSLGGRIGCLLDREIPPDVYGRTLVAMRAELPAGA